MSMKIDTGRYAECTTLDELTAKLTADLAPVVNGIHLLRNRVLVASFIRPEKTSGGIIRPDAVREEDKWQGKAGLILAVGPSAFEFPEIVDDIDQACQENGCVTREDISIIKYERHNLPRIGDWVFFRGSDTWDSGLQVAPGVGAHCRFIFDDAIIGRIADPATIW